MRSFSKRFIVVAVGVIIATIFYFLRAPSAAEMMGTYTRAMPGVTETLVLSSNNKFIQNIRYDDGRTWKTNGQWQLHNRAALFVGFYETYDEEHGLLLKAPQPVTIAFEAKKGSLSRELGPIWVKTND